MGNLVDLVTDALLTSVVILSYNRKSDLQNNLRSLYANTHLPFEVIIFDNASERETIDYLKSVDGIMREDHNGHIKVIYSDKNIGCSGGRREVVKYASGDYIYSIDNDMTYTTNWLNALISRIEQDRHIGAVCSKIIYPNKKIQLNGGLLFLEDNYFGSFVEVDAGKHEDGPLLTGEMDCDWLPGGATLYRREALRHASYKPEYLNGFEDYDYSFQLIDAGYRVVNCPNSWVYHHHIGFDQEKQKKEAAYLKDRWNAERTWKSMVYFLERTGINMIKTGGYYKWIERDGTKPFLQWGEINGRKFSYPDLFPGIPFCNLNNAQIRHQFDAIVAKNKEMRR